jgi:hypothetical protein
MSNIDGDDTSDKLIGITTWRSVTETIGHYDERTLPELHDDLKTTQAETKSELPMWEFGKYKGPRCNENLVSIFGIELDIDNGKLTVEGIVSRFLRAGIECIIHTTPSHRPDKPRVRVLLPTSAELPPTERYKLVSWANGILDGNVADESFSHSRAFYYGHLIEDPDFFSDLIRGQYIDTRVDLAKNARGKSGTTGEQKTNGEWREHVDINEMLRRFCSGEAFHPSLVSMIGSFVSRSHTRDEILGYFRPLYLAALNSNPRYVDRWPEIIRIVDWCLAQEAKKEAPPPPNPDIVTPSPWIYRDPSLIKPRPWLLGTWILRGYATVLGSTGGVGKTSLAIACALAEITGRRDITEQHVFLKGNVWYITLEDDRDEIDRRIAASMIAHGVSPMDVAGKLFVNDTSKKKLILAYLNAKQEFRVGVDVASVIDGIRKNNILLTIIDPLIKSHRSMENSNEHMDGLITILNGISRDTDSAVMIPAHFRKSGTGDNGANRDAVRGGSALIDGARIARNITPMSGPEAETLGVKAEEACQFISVADAKSNFSQAQSKIWFHLRSIQLNNTAIDPAYPSGDHVQAAVPWKPGGVFSGMDVSHLRRIFDRIDAGPGNGWRYNPNKQNKYWGGKAIIEEGDRTEVQAKSILKQWLDTGVLTTEVYTTPMRNKAQGLEIDKDKVSEILGSPSSIHEKMDE